jgi:hypothetical protein
MKKYLEGLSIVAAVIPFTVYFVERVTSVIPDENTWYASGTNHGPWRWGIESIFVYYPCVIFLLVVLFNKQISSKIKFFYMVFLVVSLVAQLYFLTWTVD